jgi:hypothetical protein
MDWIVMEIPSFKCSIATRPKDESYKEKKPNSYASKLSDERGSTSILTIALFLITVVLVMMTTNISTVSVAKRNLTQSAESVAQRGAHFLDRDLYYSGKFNSITMVQKLFGEGPTDPGIPIDCDAAQMGINEALEGLYLEKKLLISERIQGLRVSEISCNTQDIRVELVAVVTLPFHLPFLKLDRVTLKSAATTFNQRNNGFYLFGIRLK